MVRFLEFYFVKSEVQLLGKDKTLSKEVQLLLCFVFRLLYVWLEVRHEPGASQQIPLPQAQPRLDCLDCCSSQKSFVGLRLALPSVVHPDLVGLLPPVAQWGG